MKKTLLTLIHSSLMPQIIIANLLLIFGIVQTKMTTRFTSSQVLFIVLFVDDLTIGVVQLPMQIYNTWKSQDPQCFGIQLRAFSCILPVCMSCSRLFLLSREHYLS